MKKDKTYRALVAEEKNGIFRQSVKRLQVDNLPDHDVLVRVHYSSLNYKDVLSASGNKSVTKTYPFTPGIDAAGIVEESGDSSIQKGDKVIVTSYDLGMNTPGGFGEYIRVPGEWIVPLPDGLSLKESMMIGTSGLTAAIGVEKIVSQHIRPQKGSVLVTGATGGVGSFAVALLSHLGFSVIAATGKTDQKEWLKSIGAASVIHRDNITSVPDKPLLSSRWTAALDTVGGSMLDAVIRQTGHNGVVTCCGNILGHQLETSIYPFILRGVSLMGIDSGIALMEDRLRIWNKLATEWKHSGLELLTTQCSLEDLPDEIRKIRDGKQVGKSIVLHQPRF
jgi:putative YhdH/YhfP family quinone oxidoreductase